jgi:hypothetical protein
MEGPPANQIDIKVMTESRLIVAEAVIDPPPATLFYDINSELANALATLNRYW